MKNLKKIVVTIFCIVSILSCSKNDNEITNNDDIVQNLKKESIEGKWNIDNTIFKSIEFNNDGNYIIVKTPSTSSKNNIKKKTDPIVLFGTYTLEGNNIINLLDFGTIILSKMDSTTLEFSITENANPDKTFIVTSNKTDEIPNTTNTDKLCRSWKMHKVNGEDLKDDQYKLTVLFSKAGTYFVEYEKPIEDNYGGLAEWKWKDNNEVALCYSWEGSPICDNDATVSVNLEEDNYLIIIEDNEKYELVPATASSLKTSIKSKNKKAKQANSSFFFH